MGLPYVHFAVADRVTPEVAEHLKAGAAEIFQRHAGKEENWLYVHLKGEQTLYFQGKPVTSGGVIEVKLIGELTSVQKQAITAALTALLHQELGAVPERIYVIFTSVKAENWGWNGSMFG